MPGWGSAIVELQLAHYGLPYRPVETGDMFKDAGARARLAGHAVDAVSGRSGQLQWQPDNPDVDSQHSPA